MLLRESAAALQQTIVMVTHDPRAASYADRVVFLKDGRIVQKLAIEAKSGESDDIRNIMRVMRDCETGCACGYENERGDCRNLPCPLSVELCLPARCLN